MKRNNLSMYLLITAALLVTFLILAGCASAGSSANTAAADTTMAVMTTAAAAGETTAAAGAVVKNEISIKGNTFSPDNLNIKVGDTVTWVNNDSYAHTVKATKGEFDSGNMSGGAKFSFTFDKEGTVDYICGIHTFMTGKIIITK